MQRHQALGQLAHEHLDIQREVCKAGGIPLLLALLSGINTDVQVQACAAISSLAQGANGKNRRKTQEAIAKAGGIGDEVTLFPLLIEPDRPWLYDRCNQRFAAMVEGGALEEVAALLERELDPDLPVMRAIGVPEIAAYLEDVIPHETMIAAGQQATRHYAKRQFTWFRGQPPSDWERVWVGPESENIDIGAYFASLLRD
jgi:hypothetical protein